MEGGRVEGMTPSDSTVTTAGAPADVNGPQRRRESDRFAHDLRDALTTAAATGTIAAPVAYPRLLRMILSTAAGMVGARAAALFLIDAEQRHLVLEVAEGDQTAESEKYRLPLGQGVAGLVAQTGSPMVISDTPEDDLDETDVGHPVGFNPKAILCMPLSFHDRIIGVLQFLDKDDAATTFSVDDMADMGLFANLAAVAIEQARTHSRMGALVAELVERIDGIPDFDSHGLTERARVFTAELGQQTGYLDALELAQLVQEVVHHGDAATEACKGILNNFAQFLRSRAPEETAEHDSW